MLSIKSQLPSYSIYLYQPLLALKHTCCNS